MSGAARIARPRPGPITRSVLIPLGAAPAQGRLRHGPARATLGLVGLNGAVFAALALLPRGGLGRALYTAGAIPWEIARGADLVDGPLHGPALVPPPFTILSSLFLHGSLPHLAGNMWFLWVFGRGVEAALGGARFLLFYLGTGVLAAVAQVAMTPGSQIPMVGASGAIAGVLGAYALLYPRARVQIALFLLYAADIVVVPAAVALSAWLLWQLLAGGGGGAIAVWAHITGFVFGAVGGKLLAAPRPRPTPTPWTGAPRPAASSSSPR